MTKFPDIENPSTHSDLELFTRQLNWDTRPAISKFFTPAFFGAFGFACAAFSNYVAKKPVLSGIQKHIALVGLGVPVGLYADKWNDGRRAKRDAQLIYYMQTHPEDFPVTERLKFKDVVLPWVPFR